MPTSPNKPPNTVMDSKIQKPERPVTLPLDAGIDDIAVNLLQDNNQNNKIQALPRINHENQEPAGDSPNKRPEERDDIRHPNNHGNQVRVWQAEDQHGD